MSATTGSFVWHDLNTPDPEAARRFYRDLLGWSYKTDPDYTHIEAAGKQMGGIVKLDPAWGAPPHWTGYIDVDDIESTAAKVPAAGGKVLVPPTAIDKVGRFAVVADPLGASFSLFQSASSHPVDPAVKAGQFCFDELLTRDPKKCEAFYAAVLGWKAAPVDMGALGTYTLWKHGGRDVGGMMQMPPDAQAPPFWLAYVAVDDVDVVQKKAAKLGAKTWVAPQDIPGVGRFSVLADPQGASFALYKRSSAVPRSTPPESIG